MAISTRISNWENIPIGIAELYMEPYAAYESDTTPVLSAGNYLGATANISLTASKKYVERKGAIGNTIVLLGHILLESGVRVSARFIEASAKNLDLAIGGDGTTPNFLKNLFENPSTMRAEMKFRFPNGSYFYIIMPTVQVITPAVSLDFNPTDAMQVPLEFSSLACSHANWSDYPYGRPYYS
jgi:hypothetical protein